MDMSRKTIPFSHLRFDEIGLEFLEILNIFETNEKERYIFIFSATALDAVAVMFSGTRPFCRCVCSVV